MSGKTKLIYAFEDFELDTDERVLRRAGKTVPLTPKAYDLLDLLVKNAGRLLVKEELMETLWRDSFVEEGNLTFNISTLRKALGEEPKARRFIETVPKSGYRFVAEVNTVEVAEDGSTPPVEMISEFFEINERPVRGVDQSAPDGGESETAIAAEPEAVSGRSRDGKSVRRYFAAALFFVGLASLIFVAYKLIAPFPTNGDNTAPQANVIRLTTARNTTAAAISPDGKFVAYSVDEARRESLWLRQVEIGSDNELIPPAEVAYRRIAFSKDGNYVYFFKTEAGDAGELYRIPTTGGAVRKMEAPTAPLPPISPDGERFALIRTNDAGEIVLSAARVADGAVVNDLVTRRKPDFIHNCAWSPLGAPVVCVAGTVGETGRNVSLIEVDPVERVERSIPTPDWKFVDQLEWLPDGRGLLATASDYSFGPYQLWFISYPDGKARRVTNDLGNYSGISVTADAKSLVTVQNDIRPFVWVLSSDEAGKARQITFGPGTRNDYWGFSWTPDGKIVYVSTASGNQDIWIMNSDGSGKRQLTFNPQSDFDPSVSPDGQRIVFASERSGNTKIWEMDLNGENLRQLTRGESAEYLPRHTPDGRFLIFNRSDTRRQTLWKISLEGEAAPVELTDYGASWAAPSPDGKFIACWHFNETARAPELAIVPIDGGKPLKTFKVSPTAKTWADIAWTPDGKNLIYIDAVSGVGNLWRQPLEGGDARPLTDFQTERLFRFAFSRDGRRVTYSRGIETNEAVLISGFR